MLSYQHAETIRTFSQPSGTDCPYCGNSRSYNLADGRLKCSACRRVFTPTPRASRLSDTQLEGLAKRFWGMCSTAETAAELGLNVKTVQRYFNFIRQAIDQVSSSEAVQNFGGGVIPSLLFSNRPDRLKFGPMAQPLAALIANSSKISILFATAQSGQQDTASFAEVSGWLYARDPESLAKCQLDRIHCLSEDADSISLVMPFWQFAKQALNRYQGGFRHKFPLYLREMEFRYNNRSNSSAETICMKLLQESLL